ncbi:tyrosine-protein phosphatase 69D-like [Limulus polyphemus]|uniref:protein-tyrosine-phosphatase n=1 Tax=Limulus polyphemus TaxID=6850 RepID=A0ABM1B0L2_LIMPO|nr:tyrosine-protein phosphatase 69D-like [Limulus polyphemus]
MVRVIVQVETKKMISGLPQFLISLACFISASAPLSILNHEVNPPLVANCSTTVLTCQVDTPAPAVDVWWTFRGENASKLPNVNIVTDRADDGIWQLQLLCPTPEHAGSFACNAQSRNESELVYRKEETVDVYVPIFIEVEETNSSNLVSTKVQLQCLVTAFPRAVIQWEKDGQALKVEEGRVDIQVTQISEVVDLGSVTIDVLKREDNGTYTCLASNAHNMSRSTQDITVLEPPEVSLDSLEAKDPRTASLSWHVRYRGNLPVKRFHLQVRNFSTGADWLDVDNNIEANLSVYTVRYLSPAMTYSFQLAAVNDAGYSDWENLNITMPADVPPRVSWIHVLASTNETLLLGWRRPRHDNGANITHYLVQLHHNGEVIANETMTVMPNPRNNYMYIFVNLEPGEDYIFQVKACSIIGCGNWSEPMEAGTSDGMADPPEHVEIKCLYDAQKDLSYVVVTWEPPANPRGTIQSYNITLEASARYRATNGKTVVDKLAEVHEVKGDTSELKSIVKPNTNYTVRICTKNRSGCGPLSIRTTRTMCSSPPSAPSSMPKFQLQRMKEKHNHKQLRLTLQRISERNGFIRCYRIIIIKLEGGESLADLPTDPSSLDITTYGEVHRKNGRGAYIAEAINTESFVSEVIIGDDRYSLCEDTNLDHPASPQARSRRVTEQPSKKSDILTEYVYDGKLAPKTNYTGFVEVRVMGPNKTILSKQSPYFAPVETGFFPKSEPTENPMAIVLGVLSGLIFVVLILILVLCLFKRKNNDPYDERDRLGLTALIRRTIQRNGHIPRCKSTRLSKTPYLGPITAEDLPSAYVERHSDSDLLFQSEFEALPEKFKDRSTHASDSPENLSKNRYPDIRSFDQTRVRLPMEDGITGSDYINADFVEGYKNRKLFICAQGPLDRTVTDFWRMIWEHKVTVIVMLTGVEEHGKIKCAQYWNESESKEIENLFVVNVITTKTYSDYIVRRFHVQFLKDDYAEEREILHFHFVMWKDFLAPEQPSWLLRFIKRVNEHYVSDRGPLLVHCSAGVGRTGTFVAIDTLVQQLGEEGQVDVYGCVSNLRHSRNFLVQSLKQYIFVYRALLEHAQFGDTEMEIRHFKDHYEHMKEKVGDQEKTRLELEFEKLGDVIEDPKTCCVGTMDMNMNKNRHNFIIPYDINRVILPPTASRDHSSYINASFIQGYDRSLSFIITQDPLENTVTEFWRMVKEQTITTVVMLSELGEGQTKCQQYWPREEEKEYDYIKVKFQNEETRENITKREFQVINTKNNDNHTLTQFQFLGWSSTVPENTIAFIDLIEQAQQNKEQDPSSGPVTVHCSGGGDRSSIFVTLSVLIQQLKNEERVDVFQAARYTRSQRQCMLKTLAHYEFLYQGMLDYIHTHKLYDMGDTPL